jgi:hypothetical protein
VSLIPSAIREEPARFPPPSDWGFLDCTGGAGGSPDSLSEFKPQPAINDNATNSASIPPIRKLATAIHPVSMLPIKTAP